jgi:hypothetical protein
MLQLRHYKSDFCDSLHLINFSHFIFIAVTPISKTMLATSFHFLHFPPIPLCWQPIIFFVFALKAAYTPCLIKRQIIVALCYKTSYSFLRQLQFGFVSVFTTESVKTPLSSFGLSSSLILTIGLLRDCKNIFSTYFL